MYPVKLFYGPYEAHGAVRHRQQRLNGLTAELESRNITYELIPWCHWDRFQATMCDHQVFQCRLTHLLFNVGCSQDTVCQRVVDAILDMSDRIGLAETYFMNRLMTSQVTRFLEDDVCSEADNEEAKTELSEVSKISGLEDETEMDVQAMESLEVIREHIEFIGNAEEYGVESFESKIIPEEEFDNYCDCVSPCDCYYQHQLAEELRYDVEEFKVNEEQEIESFREVEENYFNEM